MESELLEFGGESIEVEVVPCPLCGKPLCWKHLTMNKLYFKGGVRASNIVRQEDGEYAHGVCP